MSNDSIDVRAVAVKIAERVLPCLVLCTTETLDDTQHYPKCPAYYRPTIADAIVKDLGPAIKALEVCDTWEEDYNKRQEVLALLREMVK